MKLLSLFLFFTLSLFAQNDELAIYSPQTKQMFQTEQKTVEQAVNNTVTQSAEQQQKAVAASATGGGTSDIMIVDPKVLADDWVNAFNALKEKRLLNISFVVRDGPPISSVINIEPLPGGYLMLFTTKTLQGPQYQIVKTSTITTIISK